MPASQERSAREPFAFVNYKCVQRFYVARWDVHSGITHGVAEAERFCISIENRVVSFAAWNVRHFVEEDPIDGVPVLVCPDTGPHGRQISRRITRRDVS